MTSKQLTGRQKRVLKRIREIVEPISWVVTKEPIRIDPENFEPYPLQSAVEEWIKLIDAKIGQVKQILQEEGYEQNYFGINVRFGEDWSLIGKDENEGEHILLEEIYKHIRVYVPLLIYAVSSLYTGDEDEESTLKNIDISTDS